jgi:hypothetical protein
MCTSIFTNSFGAGRQLVHTQWVTHDPTERTLQISADIFL